jgi:hypothetical protein
LKKKMKFNFALIPVCLITSAQAVPLPHIDGGGNSVGVSAEEINWDKDIPYPDPDATQDTGTVRGPGLRGRNPVGEEDTSVGEKEAFVARGLARVPPQPEYVVDFQLSSDLGGGILAPCSYESGGAICLTGTLYFDATDLTTAYTVAGHARLHRGRTCRYATDLTTAYTVAGHARLHRGRACR